MQKLYLLDAYALIYRAYYAFIKNPRINSKGMNTSAVMGFVNTINDVITREQPTYIGVAFDPSGPTFRHEAYEQYKAQREETPEVIRESVPVIKEFIKAYNIPIFEVPGFEADDVIGTLAKQAEKRGVVTYMMTPDKDYGQLVSETTFIYRPKYGDKEFEVMGVERVKEKFGIETTQQVIDLLGLMGDSSDNIPGVPGIGEKTAIKLIAEFGSLDGLSVSIYMASDDYEYDEETGIRHIKNVQEMREISLCTCPADNNARIITCKSSDDLTELKTVRDLESYLRDAGLPAKDAKALISASKRVIAADNEAAKAQREAAEAAAKMEAQQLEKINQALQQILTL